MNIKIYINIKICMYITFAQETQLNIYFIKRTKTRQQTLFRIQNE